MPPPLTPPRDLTLPEPGSGTAREVLSRAIGRLLAELGQVGRGAALSPAVRDDVADFHGFIRRSLATRPGALASALRRPTAGALLRCLRPGRLPPARAEAALSELMALIYLELATEGALPAAARLRRAPRRITSLLLRAVVELPPDAAALAFEGGLPALEAQGARVTRPYHAIEGELVLALADNNPVAQEEAHPDKEGNAIDLGGRDAEAWAAALRAALAPIGRHLPDLRREMDLFIHQIVPVGHDEERHLSASYQEAIGTIYLTLHPSVMTMAEALIHELSHNKINALFELDDLLENAFIPLYTSPVRPDPRPLHGVLLAVHAFLPVARLYERMIEAGDPLAQSTAFAARYDRIRAINREGADVLLQHGRPTNVGRAVLDEIRHWTDYFDKGVLLHR